MNNEKKKVVGGLIWNYAERFSKEGVSLLISIILARLLLPEQFGSIAIVNVFIAFSNILVIAGFNTALIQKKTVDETEISSVFFFSLTVSLLMYTVLFLAAPLISDYYEMPELTNVLRVLSISLPFGAYNSIQNALLVRNLQFKKIFASSLISGILSGIAGIIAAAYNLGIWALVIQYLSNSIFACIVFQIVVKWYPHLMFSIDKLKELVSFGWKIAVSSIVDTIYNQAFNLIIGKKYSASDLAFYNRGQQFPLLLARNVTSSISTVMLPVFSQMQDEKDRLKEALRKSIAVCSFVMFPLILGLLACSRPLVLLLYTEKWAEAIPYMQLFCIAFLFYPINMANMQAVNGMGRSDLFLKLNILKKGIGFTALLICMPFGVKTIALGYALASFANVLINIYPNRKLLKYKYTEQIKDFMPSLTLSAMMAAICLGLSLIIKGNFILLITQIIVGGVFYICIAYILKMKPMIMLIDLIKSYLKRRT